MSNKTTVRTDDAEHLGRTLFDTFRRDYLEKMRAESAPVSLDDRLRALHHRRANPFPKVGNSNLYAGSPMYFYCTSCGHLADIMPESYRGQPRKLCTQCQELKDLGALD
jgi:hypothetical protein